MRVYADATDLFRTHPTGLGLLSDSVVVVVTATPDVRTSRIDHNFPDLSATERSQRLADTGADLLALGNIVELDTSDLSPEAGQARMQQLVDGIVER